MAVLDRHLSVLSETFFTRKVSIMASSSYIRAMHPKSEILPQLETIERVLKTGWVAQTKIHGHRAQIHISSNLDDELIAYTRQGRKHKLSLSPTMIKELRRLFQPSQGWTVIDTEWLKPKKKLFLFDVLKWNGEVLRSRTFPERWSLLPRAFISPHISVLPLIKDVDTCLKMLRSKAEEIEGLVFKSATSTGFSDTSIIRCRKKPS